MTFYHKRKTVVHKVIGLFIYLFIDNFICLDYLGILQKHLSDHNNKVKETKLNELSGLIIPETIMNIMSCHGFSKPTISTVIITCLSVLVPYYLSELFFIVEKEEGIFENIPEKVLNKINAFYIT